ncbi:MAG: hypothetical protein AB7W59_24800 [Acidimicrobiia bacterium]
MSTDMSDPTFPGDDEGHRRTDPIFGRRPIFGRKRAALEEQCAQLTQQIEELDRQLFEAAKRRRKLADQLEQNHRRLYRTLSGIGRAPGPDGGVQLPALPDDPRYLWGRRLRSTCRAILSRIGRATLVDLHVTLHRLGFGVASLTPVKALADALGYDADAGHVNRVRRGTYELPPGAPRPTRFWRGGPPIGAIPLPDA